ncbi:unnamed protein product [Tilletia controversa]|uniref:Protein transport protein BOS1 n=3 Tax=Tilletia TaxID=13289 RepID=A0A8X7MMQ4_9BASI|nr:hypothetical protein CF336_g6906 [Tilletia laevis]KAE8188316.1 hypothetical protein CF328_g6638 [Tilletia controversa]KAE8248137.1 hypothetical protein A4X03_0g6864 [Tilletia caries]KAE8190138.1 hypothetical protein CF335_g6440 [Tilletia laevis]KAE8241685.1 hypothetical protein A4X06_0g7439 [Tilletia controversa]
MASSLYNLGLRQSSSLRADLARIEVSPDDASLIGQITATLAAFTRTVDEFEGLARRELVPAKQEKSFARTKKFRDDAREFEGQFAKIKAGGGSGGAANKGGASGHPSTNGASPYSNQAPNGGGSSSSAYAIRSSSAATAESPYSLHARNSTTQYGNAPTMRAPGNRPYPDDGGGGGGYPPRSPDLGAYQMNASAAAMFGGANMSGTGMSAREGHALREHGFIQQTELQLDNFIAQGREVWGNLVEQRGILKETQRKLLSAANTLGLSRDVIGYIERRSTQDNIIFAVGAIFTLVCFYYIYKWFG